MGRRQADALDYTNMHLGQRANKKAQEPKHSRFQETVVAGVLEGNGQLCPVARWRRGVWAKSRARDGEQPKLPVAHVLFVTAKFRDTIVTLHIQYTMTWWFCQCGFWIVRGFPEQNP